MLIFLCFEMRLVLFFCSLLTFYCIKEEFSEKTADCCSFKSSFSFAKKSVTIEPNKDAYQEQELL